MMIETRRIVFSTEAEMDIVDITKELTDALAETGLTNGSVTLFVQGSTGAVTTMEFEPGLVEDMAEMFEKLAPRDHYYHHEERWHDKNGHSHIRASLIGPSVAVPIAAGQLMLGTWQQVVFLDFDVRARQREVVLQFIGE
jgi:secondary thiamine-phosphate synthase enzyme